MLIFTNIFSFYFVVWIPADLSCSEADFLLVYRKYVRLVMITKITYYDIQRYAPPILCMYGNIWKKISLKMTNLSSAYLIKK